MAAELLYTKEKAELFCEALRSGKRVSYASELIGVDRTTAYNWKKQYPDFAEQWDSSSAYANERMEEVVYEMGINGDLAAAMWWLRNWKPAIYNKETLIKLLLAQAQLANGGKLELDQDGSVVSIPTGDGKTDFNNVPRRVVILPDNGRNDKVANMQAMIEQAREETAIELASEPIEITSEPEPIEPTSKPEPIETISKPVAAPILGRWRPI